MSSFAVLCVFPDGEDNYIRMGARVGEGPVARYPSRDAAQKAIDFFKMGMEKGEDFEEFEILPWADVLQDSTLTDEEKRGQDAPEVGP